MNLIYIIFLRVSNLSAVHCVIYVTPTSLSVQRFGLFVGFPTYCTSFSYLKKVLLFVDRVAQFFYFVFSIRDSVFSFIRSTCKSFLTGLTGYFLLSWFQLEFSSIFLSLYWIHFLIPWIAFVILINFCLCFLELNLNFIPISGCLCSL